MTEQSSLELVQHEEQAYALTAYESVEAIKQRKLSCMEIAESCLKRIAEIEPKSKAWVCMHDVQTILDQAAAHDQRLMDDRVKPESLESVMVGVKDIFNTIDLPTCMGSPIWKGFTPGNDARVVTNLKRSGAIIPGKTVTAEFAVHHPGPTVNPYHPDHIPGTSSTGSAVAVATGMVPVAIGSQTAGSTIRPASYCGVYGFKPSFGLIPRTGALKTLDTLDHVTCFSRSVDDLRIMLESLRVRGFNHPLVESKVDPKENQLFEDKKWRVAFIHAPTWDVAADYTKNTIEDFANKMAVAGVDVEHVKLYSIFDKAHKTHDTVYTKALSYYFKEEYDENKDLISDVMQKMIERGQNIPVEDYMFHLEEQNKFAHDLEEYFQKYDIILTHSTAGVAPKYDEEELPDTSLIWTLCRAPSMNLPVGAGPNDLPFGLQVVANRFNDYELLGFVEFLRARGLVKNVNPVDVKDQ